MLKYDFPELRLYLVNALLERLGQEIASWENYAEFNNQDLMSIVADFKVMVPDGELIDEQLLSASPFKTTRIIANLIKCQHLDRVMDIARAFLNPDEEPGPHQAVSINNFRLHIFYLIAEEYEKNNHIREAFQCFSKAAQLGNNEAKRQIESGRFTKEQIAAAKTIFFAEYDKSISQEKISFHNAHKDSKLRENKTLAEILEHGIKKKSRTRRVCISLGWLLKDGSINLEKAPQFIVDIIRELPVPTMINLRLK